MIKLIFRLVVFVLLIGGIWYGWQRAGEPYREEVLGWLQNLSETVKEYGARDYILRGEAASLVPLEGWKINTIGSNYEVVLPSGKKATVVVVDKGEEIVTEEEGEMIEQRIDVLQQAKTGENNETEPVKKEEEVVVYSTDEEAVNEVSKAIDLTPNKDNWSELGEDEGETGRIAEKMKDYLGEVLPVEEQATDIEPTIIVRLTGQKFAYVEYETGGKRRIAILGLQDDVEQVPQLLGFYKTALAWVGGRWIVPGETSAKPVAILPSETTAFMKKDKEWVKR